MNNLQSNYPEQWKSILSGEKKIEGTIKVSSKSYLSDDIWDFSNEKKQRTNSVSPSKQRISWREFVLLLPACLMQNIKTLAFFYALYPSVIANDSKSSKRKLKPNTFCPKFKLLLRACLNS